MWSMAAGSEPVDHVARLRAAWARERPDIDTQGMAILGRARRIVLASRGPIEAVFTRFDLDAGEFDVLASLRRAGAPYRLRPTELFQQLMISSGGLTDRLSRLDRRGLIARVPSDQDRRSLIVELTVAGKTLVEAAFEADMAVESRLIAGLTEEERRSLADLLAKLAVAIEQPATAS
jgi:DNA-binding MarR family transcriptional regulator